MNSLMQLQPAAETALRSVSRGLRSASVVVLNTDCKASQIQLTREAIDTFVAGWYELYRQTGQAHLMFNQAELTDSKSPRNFSTRLNNLFAMAKTLYEIIAVDYETSLKTIERLIADTRSDMNPSRWTPSFLRKSPQEVRRKIQASLESIKNEQKKIKSPKVDSLQSLNNLGASLYSTMRKVLGNNRPFDLLSPLHRSMKQKISDIGVAIELIEKEVKVFNSNPSQ